MQQLSQYVVDLKLLKTTSVQEMGLLIYFNFRWCQSLSCCLFPLHVSTVFLIRMDYSQSLIGYLCVLLHCLKADTVVHDSLGSLCALPHGLGIVDFFLPIILVFILILLCRIELLQQQDFSRKLPRSIFMVSMSITRIV